MQIWSKVWAIHRRNACDRAFDQQRKNFISPKHTRPASLHKSIQSFIDNFYQAFRDESYAKGFPVWLHLLKLSPLSPPPHWTPTPCTAWSPPSPLSWSFSCLQNFPLPQKASWKDGSAPQRTFVVNRA